MGIVAHDPVDQREGARLLKLMNGAGAAANTTYGTVKQGLAVANATVAADGTSAGTQLNLLLAQLRLAGVIAT